ncbi:MAG: nitroreductase family protein [Magnetococcales bacterium]|nr:nitroreductase family protein [Magnetococcales bacterium]
MILDDPSVHELIRQRWSPRAFDGLRAVDRGEVMTLLEAARWAPSCYNTQPWRYIVALRENKAAFDRILACLVDVNQVWAKEAAVLMISLARKLHDHNGKPNRWAWHDVGAANAQLTLQATAMGLVVHQMAGYDPEAVRRLYSLHDLFDPVTILALGYPGSPEQLDGPLRDRELAPRQRKSMEKIAFNGEWGKPL